MMLLAVFIVIKLLAISVTFCNALTLPPNDGILENTLAPLVNVSLPHSNDLSIQCNGRQFGSSLNYGSCLDAFSTFAGGGSSAAVKIARRRHGAYNRALPWKWVSSTITFYPRPLPRF